MVMRGMRRVEALENQDYDHRITLADDELRTGSGSTSGQGKALGSLPSSTPTSPSSPTSSNDPPHLGHSTTNQALLGQSGQKNQEAGPTEASPSYIEHHEESSPQPSSGVSQPEAQSRRGKRRPSRESSVDVLFENQRGCIFCGIPLFSSKALGPLDPSAWTNIFAKPSPTSTATAQPPNPLWQWSDSAWWVKRQSNSDQDGWTYSFAFAKLFSWHRPHWWNSCVRRRAWFRRRQKSDATFDAVYHHSASLQPNSPITSPVLEPTASSRSWPVSTIGNDSALIGSSDIVDLQTLMAMLRRSRIDRENLEAIDSFLKNNSCSDVSAHQVAGFSAEIPSLIDRLTYQASRQLLINRLTRLCDDLAARLQSATGPDASGLAAALCDLQAGVRRGKDQIRRLELWPEDEQSMSLVSGS